MIRAHPSDLIPTNYNTLVEIDPKAGEDSVKADIELDPGRTLKGKLVGPDGEPVVGALMLGAADHFQMLVAPTPPLGRVRGARARRRRASAGCSSITRGNSSPGPTWSSPTRAAP